MNPVWEALAVHGYPVPTYKRCGSCGAWYSRETWAALVRLGTIDDGDGGVLELRNCTCGSTLAVSVGAGSSSSRLDPSGGQKEGEK